MESTTDPKEKRLGPDPRVTWGHACLGMALLPLSLSAKGPPLMH